MYKHLRFMSALSASMLASLGPISGTTGQSCTGNICLVGAYASASTNAVCDFIVSSSGKSTAPVNCEPCRSCKGVVDIYVPGFWEQETKVWDEEAQTYLVSKVRGAQGHNSIQTLTTRCNDNPTEVTITGTSSEGSSTATASLWCPCQI